MSCTNCNDNKFDLCVSQNASFAFSFNVLQDDNVTPVNITSWSFTGSIKQTHVDPAPVTYFSCSVLNLASASVKIALSAPQTWLLTGSKYIYDVIANDNTISPEITYRMLEGFVNVDFGVTAP